jgi:hypothetical protein
LVLGIGLLALLAAPQMIIRTPLRNALLAMLASDLRGTVTASGGSLGWVDPARLENVELRDARGQLVASVQEIETDRGLLSLLWDLRQLGNIRLVEPAIHVRCGRDRTNVEDVLRHWLEADEPPSLDAPQLAVEIVDGTLMIEDALAARRWQLRSLAASLQLARDWSEPLRCNVTAQVELPDRKAPCGAQLEVWRTARPDGPPAVSGKLRWQTDSFPLAVLEPLLRRAAPRAALAGSLSGDAQLEWNATDARIARLHVDGTLSGEDLHYTGPGVNPDTIHLRSWQTPLRVTWQEPLLSIQRLALQTDLGQVALRGEMHVDLSPGAGQAILQALQDNRYHVHGRIDLAALARQLPRTLRIRDGLEVTSGDLLWELARSDAAGQSAWNGRLEASKLTAIQHGRRISWDNPIRVEFAARQSAAGLAVDRLVCASEFLHVEGSGSPESFTATARCELHSLAGPLGQFVDLHNVQLAGDGTARVTWTSSAQGACGAHGECQVRGFELRMAEDHCWREDDLRLSFSLAGQAEAWRLQSVRRGELHLTSSDDRLMARLTQPLASISPETAWPLQVEASGNLTRWAARLAPYTRSLRVDHLEGAFQLAAEARLSEHEISVNHGSMQIANLAAAGAGWAWSEPKVDLTASTLRWTSAGELEIARAALQAPSLQFQMQNLLLRTVPGPQQLSGALNFQADVRRLNDLRAALDLPADMQWSGLAQGQVYLAQQGEQTQARVEITFDRPAARSGSQWIWEEPAIKLTIASHYDHTADTVKFAQLAVHSQSLRLIATGQLAALHRERQIDLAGHVDYDPVRLLALLRPYVGQELQVTAARRQRAFAIRGPLAAPQESGPGQPAVATSEATPRAGRASPPESRQASSPLAALTASGSFDWTGASAYGFRLGAGEIRGQLRDGALHFDRLDLALSDGRLTAQPALRLSPSPPTLHLEPGASLQRIRITPEMCNRGLKYIAPLLAGATQAQGEFSIDLKGCDVPLREPERGELAGDFSIHAVEIAPTPLVQELAGLVELLSQAAGRPKGELRIKTARLKKESVVPFRMVDGRVYHQDLQLEFEDVTIRTYGAVGLDQSLAVMASVSAPKLFAKIPGWASLKRNDLEIPVSGTLSRPKVDHEHLGKLLAPLAGAALIKEAGVSEAADKVKGLIDQGREKLFQGVDKQLDKLFKPKPK